LRLAATAGVPVVPIGIRGTATLLPVHGRLSRTRVMVRIGEPVAGVDAMRDAVARAFVRPLRVSVVWCTGLLRHATADRLTRAVFLLLQCLSLMRSAYVPLPARIALIGIVQAVSVTGSVGFVGRDLGLFLAGVGVFSGAAKKVPMPGVPEPARWAQMSTRKLMPRLRCAYRLKLRCVGNPLARA